MTMKSEDYMLTIKNLITESNLTDDDKQRLMEYTAYLIEYENDHNLGKAYGYLKKQYTMQQLEISELKRTIKEMKEVF